jgi:cytochrome P450
MTTPRGPTGRFLTGSLAEFRADRLAFFTRCAREYGDVVSFRLLGRPVLLLNRPDLVEQVLVTHAKNFVKHFGLRLYKPILGNGLVTSEGDFWRRQRKLSAPAFQASRLPAYADAMVEGTGRMMEEWATGAHAARNPQTGCASNLEYVPPSPGTPGEGRGEGSPILNIEDPHPNPLPEYRERETTTRNSQTQQARDVNADMMRLTLQIACKTLFGADACPDPEVVGRAMEEGLEGIAARFRLTVPLPSWLPTPSNLRLRRSMRTLHAVVADLIAGRRAAAARAGGGGGDDLLSTLLAARDENGAPMTPGQLLDEVLTLLLAGHETTALALSYALHLLAHHPDAQDSLAAELSDVLGDRLPAYADLPRLPFTRNVVTETMRLYPPADFLGREAVVDCTVGDIPVKRGTNLFVSQWVLHRDARFFPDPLAFDPNRWTPAFEASLPRFAYFPFGGGPRFCIGQTFAAAEGALVLATLCQRFRFAPDPTFRLELHPGITLRPRAGVRLIVQPRPTSATARAGERAGAAMVVGT